MARTNFTLSLAVSITLISPFVSAADYSAPVISGKAQIQASASSPNFELYVTVTDDDLVQSVTLKYRKIGSKLAYTSLPLPRVYFEKDLFGLVLDSSFSMGQNANYEYFVEAIDTARNISQQPFPKSPHYFYSNSSFSLGEKQVAKKEGELSNYFSGNKKWWVIGAGVLVSGLILSKSGGGSSDSGETSTINIITPIPNTQ